MPGMQPPKRTLLKALLAGGCVLAIAIPTLAASPAPSGDPGPSARPEKSAKPDKADKPDKAEKAPETAVTVTGTIESAVDADGDPSYTLTAAGKTWTLSAGPAWFWGDKNPLKAFVGKSVTIAGTTEDGESELDVATVDGTAIREPGKPPWAGGPWVVGKSHPGWKDWMAGGKPGHGHGRDDAPGQQKKETAEPTP
jgi:hypothetical protein